MLVLVETTFLFEAKKDEFQVNHSTLYHWFEEISSVIAMSNVHLK